jgi:hypothetical protein
MSGVASDNSCEHFALLRSHGVVLLSNGADGTTDSAQIGKLID